MQDTIRDNTIENRGYFCLFVYMCGHMYVIYTLTLAYFLISLVVDPVPNFT